MKTVSIGRIVHFVQSGFPQVVPAIVSAVHDMEPGYVNLHVMVNDPGNPVRLMRSVPHSPKIEGSSSPVPSYDLNTWHWPDE